MTQYDLRQIAEAYIRKGEERINDAGYCGEMSDRGGGAMISEAHAFLSGLDGKLPSNWHGFVEDIQRKEDAERAEYERLKAKYGD